MLTRRGFFSACPALAVGMAYAPQPQQSPQLPSVSLVQSRSEAGHSAYVIGVAAEDVKVGHVVRVQVYGNAMVRSNVR